MMFRSELIYIFDFNVDEIKRQSKIDVWGVKNRYTPNLMINSKKKQQNMQKQKFHGRNSISKFKMG